MIVIKPRHQLVFLCKWGLNLKSLIKSSETLSVELTNKNIIKYC